VCLYSRTVGSELSDPKSLLAFDILRTRQCFSVGYSVLPRMGKANIRYVKVLV